MGLQHTFGRMVLNEADDCKEDDGLLGTTLTPGWEKVVHDCMQVPCDGRPKEQTDNWMSVCYPFPLIPSSSPPFESYIFFSYLYRRSPLYLHVRFVNITQYSECRGKGGPLTGFKTDQKSAMFARVLKYRRLYQPGECQVNDPGQSGTKMKRSSLQDLVDGQCPDIEKQMQAIVAQPTLEPVAAETGTSRTGTGGGGNGGGASATTGAPGAKSTACGGAGMAVKSWKGSWWVR